jgi:hypothetical protein
MPSRDAVGAACYHAAILFGLLANRANHCGESGHWAARAMVSIDGLARIRRPRR